MKKDLSILDFIEKIRKSFYGSEIVYKNGSCIKFAEIISCVFNVDFYWSEKEGHCIVKHNYVFYDISGIFNKNNTYKKITLDFFNKLLQLGKFNIMMCGYYCVNCDSNIVFSDVFYNGSKHPVYGMKNIKNSRNMMCLSKRNQAIIYAFKKGYRITDDGYIINPNGAKLKSSKTASGYNCFGVRIDGEQIKVAVHRLMAYQKYGDKIFDDGICVRHLNDIKEDNSRDNILIGTHSDNMMDIPECVRLKKAKHASSFLKKYDNDEIRAYHQEHKSYKKTMQAFNISSKGTLHYILNN